MRKLASIAFALVCVVVAVGQNAPTCDSPRQTALVWAFRAMNTAQVTFYHLNQRFAGTPELIGYLQTQRLTANPRSSQPPPGSVGFGTLDDPLPGYSLRVTVGNDGKSYTITATKNEEPCKFYGATTDERGIIFFIEPLH